MSVVVFVESANGKIAKAGLEAVYYGSKIGQTVALAFGDISADQLAALGNYGASKVVVARGIKTDDSQALTKFVVAQAQENSAQVVIFSHDTIGKAVAPRVAARLKAGLVAGAIALPETNGAFTVKKNVFSGKAFADYEIKTGVKVISVLPNSLKTEKSENSATVVENTADFGAPKVVVKEIKKDR